MRVDQELGSTWPKLCENAEENSCMAGVCLPRQQLELDCVIDFHNGKTGELAPIEHGSPLDVW